MRSRCISNPSTNNAHCALLSKRREKKKESKLKFALQCSVCAACCLCLLTPVPASYLVAKLPLFERKFIYIFRADMYRTVQEWTQDSDIRFFFQQSNSTRSQNASPFKTLQCSLCRYYSHNFPISIRFEKVKTKIK